MDNDKSLLKWSVAAVATVVVCFLLGYFVLPKGREEMPASITQEPTPPPARQAANPETEATPPDRLALKDVTASKAEEQRAEQDRLANDAAASPDPAANTAGAEDSDPGSIVLTPDNASVPPPDADDKQNAAEPASPEPSTPGAAAPRDPALDRKPTGESKRTGEPVKSVPPAAPAPRPESPRGARTEPRSDANKQQPVKAGDRPSGSRSQPRLSEPSLPRKEVRSADTKDNAPDTSPAKLLRVRVGGIARKRSETDALVNRLRDKGFKPMVLPAEGGYVVQIGAFRDRAGADRQTRVLEKAGFEAAVR